MASGDENNTISVSEYLRELKSNISTWEDIVMKSQKLNMNLKGVGQCTSSVIDSIGLLSKSSCNNVAGVDRVTQLLSEFTVMERYICEKICILNKAVQENFVVNISQQIDTWRRSISTIKRDRDIDGRKAKAEYKKSLAEVARLEKKIIKRSGRKQSLSDTMSLQTDYANQDLQNKEHFVEELERCVLRKAICEERGRYRLLLECLRPVLEAQLSMREDFDRLQRIYDELYSEPLNDLSDVPTEVEAYVRQYQVSDQSRANSFCSVYSRANSQLSLGGSSRSSSIEEDHGLSYTNNLPPYSPDNLDTSSSTLHDPNNESVGPKTNFDGLERCSDKDGCLRPSSADVDTIYGETTLYPNQALPAPRYSNLRQLKQNADKKYGLGSLAPSHSTLVRDNVPHYNTPSLPLSVTHYSDCTFSRDQSKYNPSAEGQPSRVSAPSHYSDCTLTRNTPPARDAANRQYKDNDIYSTISQIYGSASMFADVTSGTSTFKRRKPSNVTAMDAPNITDKRFFQPQTQSDTGGDLRRSHQTGTRPGRNHSDERYSADLSHLSGYPFDTIHAKTNTSTTDPVVDVNVTRAPSSRTSNVGHDPHLSRFNHGDIDHDPAIAGRHSTDATVFKQQLLHVIQTGRNNNSSSSYHQKPAMSSHIF